MWSSTICGTVFVLLVACVILLCLERGKNATNCSPSAQKETNRVPPPPTGPPPNPEPNRVVNTKSAKSQGDSIRPSSRSSTLLPTIPPYSTAINVEGKDITTLTQVAVETCKLPLQVQFGPKTTTKQFCILHQPLRFWPEKLKKQGWKSCNRTTTRPQETQFLKQLITTKKARGHGPISLYVKDLRRLRHMTTFGGMAKWWKGWDKNTGTTGAVNIDYMELHQNCGYKRALTGVMKAWHERTGHPVDFLIPSFEVPNECKKFASYVTEHHSDRWMLKPSKAHFGTKIIPISLEKESVDMNSEQSLISWCQQLVQREPKRDDWMLQLYIIPLQIEGRKTDYRVLVSISNTVPYIVLQSPNSWRMCKHNFTLDNNKLTKEVHICNLHVSDTSPTIPTFNLMRDSQWMVDYWVKQKHFSSKQAAWKYLYTVPGQAVLAVLDAFHHESWLKRHIGTYKILAFDFIIDRNFHCYLTEVNTNPGIWRLGRFLYTDPRSIAYGTDFYTIAQELLMGKGPGERDELYMANMTFRDVPYASNPKFAGWEVLYDERWGIKPFYWNVSGPPPKSCLDKIHNTKPPVQD